MISLKEYILEAKSIYSHKFTARMRETMSIYWGTKLLKLKNDKEAFIDNLDAIINNYDETTWSRNSYFREIIDYLKENDSRLINGYDEDKVCLAIYHGTYDYLKFDAVDNGNLTDQEVKNILNKKPC